MFRSAPRGERLSTKPLPFWRSMFRSALPRGERSVADRWVFMDVIVSIRAPAWGATGHRIRLDGLGLVSIRAPAWGATISVLYGRPTPTSFDPRSRVGSDLSPLPSASWFSVFQSTPPREGRQSRQAIATALACCFKPRPRASGRLTVRARAKVGHHGWFRSTPPREGRRSIPCRT
jgi:hypothetical protein